MDFYLYLWKIIFLHISTMVYYIMYQGQVTGPMSKEQMLSYGVNRETMVSADGGEWRALYTYPELMEILNTAAPVTHTGYQRQMGFGEAIRSVFSKYATFSGRAQRSEYWWWVLFYGIIYYAFASVMGFVFGDEVASINPSDISTLPMGLYSVLGLFQLVFLLPNLAVGVRRLHDTGRSGWWLLLSFLCCVGPIILIIWCCKPSDETENEYGPVPNVE